MEQQEVYTAYETSTTDTAPIESNGHSESEPKEHHVDLLVTRERLQGMEIGYFLDYEDNPRSTKAQVGFLSNFVSDGEGNYLEQEAAVKVLRKLNFSQLNQTIIAVTNMIKDTAVPNE